jgi:hypothetical protein
MNEVPQIPGEVLGMLQQLLQGPVSESAEKPQAFEALTRHLHRLTRLREEIRNVDETALAYVNASYESIARLVAQNLDTAGAAELERLGLGEAGNSIIETRMVTAQMHGWLEHIVSNIQTQRETEEMLGGKLSDLFEGTKLTPPTSAPAQMHQAQTGMYL